MLNDGFAQSLELDLLVEVKVTVIQQVHKAFQSTNWWVLAIGQTLVSLTLNPCANNALDLHYLLHVLSEVSFLFGEARSNHPGTNS